MRKKRKSLEVERVREALVKRLDHESLAEIQRGVGLPYGWLQQFIYGNIIEPGYIKIKKLAAHLKVDGV